ncbi:GNAT family N-acetyltransferase [Acutalibacter sp. 1XD8-33]|uniref:GNAT family N-acetyltransferase n=1 Tax=Acutalibacter sp. 1XD8-33 TaxID=2320081 RepID=UPI000EA081A5|nr:GNAT family N-acetyltransferase [Acutalibacter sp. 1XD8-33]RKJ40329.1 GNAT family N-acetyltransferase [Acutalibacter sp. 1XD8-33]
MNILETPRLRLRPWRMEDLEDFYAYAKNPDVGPWAGWKPHASREESREILSRWVEPQEGTVRLALEEKASGKAIGSIGIEEDGRRSHVEGCKSLGYVLGKDYWGRGLMTEAVQAAMDYAFQVMKLRLLTVTHYPQNLRSKRVIEKAGFSYEGRLRTATTIYNGEERDLCCYSLQAWEYWCMRAKKAGFSLKLPENMERDDLEAMQKEFVEVDRDVTPFGLDPKGASFERWLERTIAWRFAVPKPTYAKSTLYILDSPQGRSAGAIDLRHYLTERLLSGGGNIGYGIRPSLRGKHYAPYMLGLGMEKIKELGLEKALVCCDENNPASARTIEDCGGKLESIVESLRRYWIAV